MMRTVGEGAVSQVWSKFRFFLLKSIAVLCTLDVRSLALARVALALVLLYDIYERSLNLSVFYTNDGVLPNHFNLFWPVEPGWSLFNCLSSQSAVQFGFIFTAATYFAFLIGAGGAVVKFLTLILTMSLSTRNLFLEHGGHLVLTSVLTWCVFLPTERFYSFDAWRRYRQGLLQSWLPAFPKPERSLACFGAILTLATIYFYNATTKVGDNWQDGSAIWYSLNLSQHTTHAGFFLRLFCPNYILKTMSYFVYYGEAVLPYLILTPILVSWSRTLAIIVIFVIHGGIALTTTLGIFPWSLMAYACIILPPDIWSRMINAKKEVPLFPKNENTLKDFKNLKRGAVQVCSLALMTCFSLQAYHEYTEFFSAGNQYRTPSWVDSITVALRTKQSWRMYAPSVPVVDYAVIVVGQNENGQTVDLASSEIIDIQSQEELVRYFEKPQERDPYWIHWELRMLFRGFRSSFGFIDYYSQWLYKKFPDLKRFWVFHIERKTPDLDHRDQKFPITVKTIFVGERGTSPRYVGG